MLIVFVALPWFGWTALPRSASGIPFRDSQGSVAAVQQTIPHQDAIAGDVDRGRDLFMGRLHFEHEGPPCMGCHSVGENGILGGGAMGPDLTNVSTQRSQTEILAVLANTGREISPVMQPIYAEHPLTWEEQVDLLAFLEASAGQPEADKELLVIGISLSGFVAATGLLGFVYRGRMRGARTPLIRKVRESES